MPGRQFLAVLVLVILVSVGASGPARAEPLPLRQVDWNMALESDPHIRFDPAAFPLSFAPGPWVAVTGVPRATGDPNAEVAGYAWLDGIHYGDIDGDGHDEAVIELLSGGTAGSVAWLLFHEDDPAPRLVTVGTGYKLGTQVIDNSIEISTPRYVGFEPNCCPSAYEVARWKLNGDRLMVTGSRVDPNPEAQPFTVSAYYTAIGSARLTDAYEFLSLGYRTGHPYSSWAAGFASTVSVVVESAERIDNSNSVRVLITVADRDGAGGLKIRQFAGVWDLTWNGLLLRWQLNQADISLYPSP